jgi:hypothetical protein
LHQFGKSGFRTVLNVISQQFTIIHDVYSGDSPRERAKNDKIIQPKD